MNGKEMWEDHQEIFMPKWDFSSGIKPQTKLFLPKKPVSVLLFFNRRNCLTVLVLVTFFQVYWLMTFGRVTESFFFFFCAYQKDFETGCLWWRIYSNNQEFLLVFLDKLKFLWKKLKCCLTWKLWGQLSFGEFRVVKCWTWYNLEVKHRGRFKNNFSLGF